MNHSHVEPMRPRGGLRRLRQGELGHLDQVSTMCNYPEFASALHTACEQARRDEQTVVAMRVVYHPLPGTVGDTLGARDFPPELIERIEAVHRDLRMAVISQSEAVAMVPALRRRSDGESLASALLDALVPPIVVDGLPHHLAPRLGAALLDQENLTIETLLDGARLALEEADTTQPTMFFHPYQRVRHQRRTTMECDLQAAIVADEMSCALQPAYGLARGDLQAFEVFARWKRGGKHWVPATEFIEVVRRLRVDHLIGQAVMALAVPKVAEWLAANEPNEVTTWFNVTPDEVVHPEFVRRVQMAIEIDSNVKIGLELSPSPPAEAREVYESLKRVVSQGARVAIGDFGIGNANLTVIRQLPFEAVKLDRALISQIDNNEEAAATVGSLIELARRLDLEVTGQGVERRSQADRLSNLGCELGQGYLFGEPAPDLDEFSARWTTAPGELPADR